MVALLCCVCVVVDIVVVLSEVSGYLFVAVDVLFDIVGVFIFVFVVLFNVFGALPDAADLVVAVSDSVSVDGVDVLVDAFGLLVEVFDVIVFSKSVLGDLAGFLVDSVGISGDVLAFIYVSFGVLATNFCNGVLRTEIILVKQSRLLNYCWITSSLFVKTMLRV